MLGELVERFVNTPGPDLRAEGQLWQAVKDVYEQQVPASTNPDPVTRRMENLSRSVIRSRFAQSFGNALAGQDVQAINPQQFIRQFLGQSAEDL